MQLFMLTELEGDFVERTYLSLTLIANGQLKRKESHLQPFPNYMPLKNGRDDFVCFCLWSSRCLDLVMESKRKWLINLLQPTNFMSKQLLFHVSVSAILNILLHNYKVTDLSSIAF